MWYHYLAILIALYLVGSSIYSLVTGQASKTGYVITSTYIIIGLIIGIWAYKGITAPVVAPIVVGGFRF